MTLNISISLAAIAIGSFFTGLSSTVNAVENDNRAQYEKKHPLHQGDAGDDKAIEKCLAHWNTHPFKDKADRRYRTVETSVKVMGIGGDVVDNDATSYPQLILIKPSVKVMSKSTFTFNNPNGWYCFQSNVTVLGKSIVNAHCDARIADSSSSVVVMGKNEGDRGGVTVLGKTEVNRINCK